MGMFDYIEYDDTCPKCGATLKDFQSKDGQCTLSKLRPKDVRNFYTSCDSCKTWVEYHVEVLQYIVHRSVEGEDEDEIPGV